MAFRTTIYCGDDTETRLQVLLRTAKDDPANWSSKTGKPAPTNTNQLFSLLIEIGYDLVTSNQPAAVLGEPKPIWETLSEIGASAPSEAWSGEPKDLATNLDHYLYDAPREDE